MLLVVEGSLDVSRAPQSGDASADSEPPGRPRPLSLSSRPPLRADVVCEVQRRPFVSEQRGVALPPWRLTCETPSGRDRPQRPRPLLPRRARRRLERLALAVPPPRHHARASSSQAPADPDGEWELPREVLRDFRMGIPPYYLALIDADDPTIRSCARPCRSPRSTPTRDVGDEDPLGEEKFSPVPGITHRYPDRVLMVISNSCAVYCRYCTRKRIMYEDARPDCEIDQMVDYIAAHAGRA
jgi:hypothetical protein